MNEQPPEFVSQIVSVIMFMIFSFYFVKNMNKPFSDFYELGYIKDIPDNTAFKPANTQLKKTKEHISPFQLECIDVLVSLGETKKSAKQKVNQIFQNHTPKDIQEFIKISFKA